ncbi:MULTISPECIES: LysM peptidoglycan-binding domain-containing protein [Paenibacillus]|uniref:LysM peptidoglycan-binding domain-containing protein n=1 Tax=Paenibacillus TaxID=44249 RepID=UPI00203CF436|nr:MULTISPECIES: LysM peptidoglycan-binding domain-containing protein [Paenibacillus]
MDEMNKYSMTLSYNNEKEAIEFPVLPAKIEVSESGNHKTYDISKLGEINVLRNVKLAELSFEGIFPATWFPGASVAEERLFEPKHYVEKIQEWSRSKQPMRLVFTGGSIDIAMYVSVEKFSWSESSGAVGDIKYQISLKEYRFYAATKTEVVKEAKEGAKTANKSSTESKPRPDTRVQPKTYTLVAGDSLWKVAKKFLGDGAKYKQIQKLNGIKDSELRKLPIGKIIKLP